MSYCTAVYCTSSRSRKIEGITFHSYPKDPQRRAQWVAAVNRRDWRPTKRSQLCSLHFEEDAFFRCSTMRVYLKPDAVPTIFPVDPDEIRVTKKSKKRPRDPTTNLLEPHVILQEGSDLHQRNSLPAKLTTMPIVLGVTPIAVEKVKKLYPWPEPDAGEVQVKKEPENEPEECPITPQEPCSGVESISIAEVRSIKESEEQPRDIALQSAMDGSSTNASSGYSGSPRGRPKKVTQLVSTNLIATVPSTITSVPASSATHVSGSKLGYFKLLSAPTTSTVSTPGINETTDIPVSNSSPATSSSSIPSSTSKVPPADPTANLKAPGTLDGAKNSVMMVNLVCPHCQKACKVCLNIKPPQPLGTLDLTNLRSKYKKKVKILKTKIENLEANKQSTIKKVKLLHQSIRRLRMKNEQLLMTLKTESHSRKTVKSVKKEKDLMVIGTINGVLSNNDDI